MQMQQAAGAGLTACGPELPSSDASLLRAGLFVVILPADWPQLACGEEE